jgi:DNA phosphorothioation-dependent restriction protein DptG
MTIQLPGPFERGFKSWWRTSGLAWTDQLRSLLNELYNLDYQWQLSEEEKNLFQQFYDANKLLMSCLNSRSSASEEVKRQIRDTLLLPIPTI